MTKRFLVALAAIALASFGLAACGGDDDEDSSASSAESTTSTTDTGAAGAATNAAGGGSTIAISADPSGALAFEQTDVTAAAGSDTLDFTNDSSTPHDVVIEDSGGGEVGKTDVIQGDSATATVDLKPGTYTFFCSVDGHREAGMEGTLTVK